MEDNGETVNYINNEAVRYCGMTDPYILHGHLTVDLDHTNDNRADKILSLVVSLALEDVGDHFAHPQGRWTWSMKYNGRYG